MSENFQGPVHRERRHKRVSTREVTATLETLGGPVSMTVANLSIGGALLAGRGPLERGEVWDIELKLKGTKAVTVRGEVVHVRNEGIGIAFQGVGAEETAALEKLITTAESKNALPPPLPANRRGTDELPAFMPRPEDPFAAEHDPRPPRSGSPDERAEYLRLLLKNRDETIRKAKAAYTTVVSEADQLRGHVTKMKSKLDALGAQQALTEVAIAGARAETERERQARLTEVAQEREGRLAERQTHEQLLEQEQRRTLEAIAAVSGLEAKMRRHEHEAKVALEEAENARKEAVAAVSEASNVRRAREELMQANRKAMENQTALTKEKAARTALEKQLSDEQSDRAAANQEVKTLKEEMARLKAKLVNAENAIERMASRSAGKAAKSPVK
jgi:hypothetical protein